jgi:hypothetical protein
LKGTLQRPNPPKAEEEKKEARTTERETDQARVSEKERYREREKLR